MRSITIFFVLFNVLFVEGWVRTFILLKTELISLRYFQRPYSVNFLNLSYVVSQPKIVDYKFTLVTVNDIQYLSFYLHIQKNIPVAYAHITVLMDSGNDTYDMLYVNRTLSVCKFLENSRFNPLIGVFYQVLLDVIELPQRCPILKVKMT